MGGAYGRTVTSIKLAIAIAAVVLAVGIGLGSGWVTLHGQWTALYGPNEHGYLVLAMAIWIGVQDWRSDPPRTFAPSGLAFLGVAAIAAALAAMELVYIDSTRLVLLPPLFLCAVSAVLGWHAGRRLFWGAMFVYFALPVWEIFNGLLQNLTVVAVSSILRLTGVPAHIDGNVVDIPAGTFEIASGCSGLNYLQAGLALASFVALTQFDSWKNRVMLVGLTAAGAIVFNWLRVYFVILVGHATDMQHYLVRVEHHTFGWALFLLLVGPVIFLGLRLERPAPAGPARAAGAPVEPGRRLPDVPWSSILAALPVVLLLAVPRLLASDADDGRAADVQGLPDVLGDTVREPAIVAVWSPDFVNADQDIAAFARGSFRVIVFRAVYLRQDGDHRLIDAENDLFGGAFRPTGQGEVVVATGSGALTLAEHRGELQGQEHLLWTWYEIGGRTAVRKLDAKLAELAGRIRGRTDAAVVALLTPCVPDCETARRELRGFVATVYEELRPELPVE